MKRVLLSMSAAVALAAGFAPAVSSSAGTPPSGATAPPAAPADHGQCPFSSNAGSDV